MPESGGEVELFGQPDWIKSYSPQKSGLGSSFLQALRTAERGLSQPSVEGGGNSPENGAKVDAKTGRLVFGQQAAGSLSPHDKANGKTSPMRVDATTEQLLVPNDGPGSVAFVDRPSEVDGRSTLGIEWSGRAHVSLRQRLMSPSCPYVV